MREIKFRVWDKKIKQFLLGDKGDSFAVANSYDLNDFFTFDRKLGSSFGFFTTWASDRYVYQQFTGFKDKNGKEIYEGDILKRECYTNWKVIFYEGSFRVMNVLDTGPDESWKYFVDKREYLNREVIGNIFENPELLKW